MHLLHVTSGVSSATILGMDISLGNFDLNGCADCCCILYMYDMTIEITDN